MRSRILPTHARIDPVLAHEFDRRISAVRVADSSTLPAATAVNVGRDSVPGLREFESNKRGATVDRTVYRHLVGLVEQARTGE